MARWRDISIGERVVSAFLGALLGALVGAILFWLVGVYSQTMGPGRVAPDAARWILAVSGVFAGLGLIIGSHVGSAIGMVLAWLFEFERQDANPEVPTWFAIMVLIGVVVAVAWWFKT